MGAWVSIATRQTPVVAEEFLLWPEHERALDLWKEVQGSLRWDQGLPTGLIWVDVRAHPATRRIPREEREGVLQDLSVLERAWIEGKLERRTVTHHHG